MDPPTVENKGDLFGSIGGSFPLDTWFDLINHYKAGRWVTIIDESKEPITLAEIRIYGSESDLDKLTSLEAMLFQNSAQ